jgi:hypothetical protein
MLVTILICAIGQICDAQSARVAVSYYSETIVCGVSQARLPDVELYRLAPGEYYAIKCDGRKIKGRTSKDPALGSNDP